MTIKIVIEKELEDWWGVDDLIVDMPNATNDEIETAIIELVNEDLPAFLNDSTWKISGYRLENNHE